MQKILRRESGRSATPQLVWGVSVDQEGSILNIEQISQDGLDEHRFLPADILNVAVQKQAAAFMLVHNHPAGQLAPTESDKSITARLIRCGEILGMPLLDHLIIDGKDHFSFRDKGLLKKLDESSKNEHFISYEDIFGNELEETMEENDRLKFDIVTMMRQANYPIEAIIAKTGLSHDVVLALMYRDEDEIDPDSHFESAKN